MITVGDLAGPGIIEVGAVWECNINSQVVII